MRRPYYYEVRDLRIPGDGWTRQPGSTFAIPGTAAAAAVRWLRIRSSSGYAMDVRVCGPDGPVAGAVELLVERERLGTLTRNERERLAGR